MKTYEKYMLIALSLAKKGEGRTSPNPLVGAIVVKDGKIIGRGFHKKAGSPHAEVSAIAEAGRRASGATLYVTLEPCGHYGRTGPCTDLIIKSGIAEVIIAMKDPNPINNGKGIKTLKAGGISTRVGVLEPDAVLLNKPFIKYITKRMPYVVIKAAESLDGKIAAVSGDSKWISAPRSRRYCHILRRKVDAVMVGVNTVIKDDPLLLSKASGSRQPARIVVDSRLRTPLDSKVFTRLKESSLIIATADMSGRIKKYEDRGAQVFVFKSKEGKVDLKRFLSRMAAKGLCYILAEGGGELNAALIEQGLADRAMFFIAPKIIGGRAAVTSVEGKGVKSVDMAVHLKNIEVKRFSDDILVEGDIAYMRRRRSMSGIHYASGVVWPDIPEKYPGLSEKCPD